MGYRSVHRALVRQYGPASSHTCPCGQPAQDWALQPTLNPLFRDERGTYSEDPSDYKPMCKFCHRRLDRESYIPSGHRIPIETRQANGVAHANKMAKVRRRCAQCPLESHPVGVGRHQKASGHEGWVTL